MIYYYRYKVFESLEGVKYMTNKQMSVNIISDDDISDDIVDMLSDTSFLDTRLLKS